jgi:hypothetical protein
MTNYDKLVKNVLDHLHNWYVIGQMDSNFDEDLAKRDVHKILKLVENYRPSPAPSRWRASD